MREYETIFVVKPNATEKDLEELKTRLSKLISNYKGTILLDRSWGKRGLAFPMEKQKEGFYIQLDYAAEIGAVSEIEKVLRFDERVLRQMTVVLQQNVDVEKRAEELKKMEEAAALAALQPMGEKYGEKKI